MTRLFRVKEDGAYHEVETNDRLAGIYDAILIAEGTEDGKYWYDYQNGQYQELVVSGGKVQTFGPDSIVDGTPGADFDKSTMEETVSDSVSVFGTVLPTDGSVGIPYEKDVPAVEEF